MTRRSIAVTVFCASAVVASSGELYGEVVPLFDGKTLAGWTTLEGGPITSGWRVKDGMIQLNPHENRTGHIITDREFGDFRLQFEWKIAPGGNSGLKYRVRDYSGKWYGCEYQILDDHGYRRRMSPLQLAGALYDLYEPDGNKPLYPAGQFNSSQILVQADQIKHWLNGRLVVSATVGDDQWQRRVAASKFSELNDFGRNRRGRIMLTDHGSEVWFRNFKLELLNDTEQR